MYARRPVDIFVIEKGQARRFSYSPSLFQAPHDHPLTKLGAAGGFSGFRLMNKGNIGDWLAFQGASYFRSRSEEHTSELQSLMRISYAVFCLKKTKLKDTHNISTSY